MADSRDPGNRPAHEGPGAPPARIEGVVPVFGIHRYQDAVAHYVDWLGFHIDWEWREAEGQPVIMAISRDQASFMLNEYPDTPKPATVTLRVANLAALVAEWNERRPGSAKLVIEPPYEFPAVRIADGCHNVLHFQEPGGPQEQASRAVNRGRMRDYVRERLAKTEPFPTPEELRRAIGPDLGTAVEVLNEFPGYAAAFRARLDKPD